MIWIDKFSEIAKKNNLIVKSKPPVVEVYAKISVPILVIIPHIEGGRYDVQCIGDRKFTITEKDLTNESRMKEIINECLKHII